MALTRDKKKEVVDKVRDIVKNSETVVFANFHGLPISKEQEMRGKLRDEGVGYAVVKKRLAKLALKQEKVEGTMPSLEGELAIAYIPEGKDPIAPARGINDAIKEFKKGLSIIGGIFGGKYLDASRMQDIAEIPSLHVLHGQVVNIINSPIQKFVVALGQIAEKRA